MSYRDDYWEELIEMALAKEGIRATKKQIKNIGHACAVGAENIERLFCDQCLYGRSEINGV